MLKPFIRNPGDIKVMCKDWKWTATSPWPPVERVLASTFWSDDSYAEARETLKREQTQTTVLLGGKFATVETTRQKAKPKGVPAPEAAAGDVGVSQVEVGEIGMPAPAGV